MSYAHILRTVRAHFDLPQHALATWLGLSRQQVTRIEADADALPGHAVRRLLPWLTVLDPAPAPEPVTLPRFSPAPSGPKPLVDRWYACVQEAGRLTPLLRDQQARTVIHRRRLAVALVLLATLPPPPPAPAVEPVRAGIRRRWAERLREAAADALLPDLATNAPTAEALLRSRRNACLHEAAELAAYMGAG